MTAFAVTLVNAGSQPVTLVEPGDGSDAGWRTPILTWRVRGDGHQAPPLLRCGNVNAVRAHEGAFVLGPGSARIFRDWVPSLRGMRPGTYQLVLEYENDPAMPWQGVPLGPHDEGAMMRIRASTPCRVVSNAVLLTVVAATDAGR